MADYYSYNSSNGGGFLANVPTVTKNLIVINVLLFLATLINQDAMYNAFALYFPLYSRFRWWQFFTHMFMHGGFWHLFFNMYTLFLFGSVVERMIGQRKFLIFYFVCGLGAAALHTGVEFIQGMGYPTVGASGAIYGLLIAYAMMFPESKMTLLFPPVTLSAKWMVIVFAVIELGTGVTGLSSGIAHFAHLGGMLFGWLLIKYWKSQGTLYNRD